jgi:hypothetical protein
VDNFFSPRFFHSLTSLTWFFGGCAALRYKDTMEMAAALEIGTQTRAVDER